MINEDVDQKYNDQALSLLNRYLPDCRLAYEGLNETMSKQDLMDHFRTAQFVMQSNPTDTLTYNLAESVFFLCRNLVRVTCLDASAKYIHVNEHIHEPTEDILVDRILSLSRNLKQLIA